MGVKVFEEGDIGYLPFNESDGYRIFQVKITKTEGLAEGDSFYQNLRLEHKGRQGAFINRKVFKNNVENNCVLASFNEVWQQITESKPVFFYLICGSETVLQKK